jgi:methyl-accepting chemotaxis protein
MNIQKHALQVRFIAILGVVALSVLTLAYEGVVSLEKSKELSVAQETAAGALRLHMEADMMHDAMRADALESLKMALSGDTQGVEASRKAMQEHIATFRDALKKNSAIELPDDIAATTAKASSEFDDYAQEALLLNERARISYESGNANYPSFLASFEALEKTMASVGDGIEQWAKNTAEQNNTLGQSIQDKIVLLSLLSAVLVLCTPILMIFWVFRPLQRLSQNMETIASGDMNVTIPAFGKNEMGAMAHSLENLRRFSYQASRWQAMATDLSLPIMVCDKDFNITFANKISIEALKGLEQYLPVKASQIVGSNIDIFHKQPSHQRGLLQKLTESGHKTAFQVGPEWLDLSASMLRDAKGNFDGAYIEWHITTEQRKVTANANRVQSMIDNLSTPVMLCDKDFNITYANNISIKTLATLEDYLPVKADKLVGSNIDIFHKQPSHQRNLLSNLGQKSFKTEISVGPEILSLNASMLTDEKGNFDGAYIDWSVITAEKKAKIEAARVQSMIDNLSLPVMLADKNYNITYVNEASTKALRTLEHLLPIKVDNLIGTSIDIFHKKPDHQRKLLADSNRLPHQTRFAIGNEWLSLNANMLKDAKGNFDGAFVDWRIVTEEVKNEESVKLAQANINELIAAANQGNLNQRIDASQFDGFYRELAQSMNGLMDTIVEPVNSAIGALGTLAEGDLTQRMDGNYEGSFAQIQMALNGTIDKLKETVQNVKSSAQSVNSASSEISAGSTDLSERTEKQASSLEETAASMEEITGTVRQNTENANNAAKLANDTKAIAEKGGVVSTNAVKAMKSIEESSQKISDIIGVIDEIAFQTNLLALNAAVEAARAGEAGKGFAVVASEVRSLAGRSASASKEIKALIHDSAAHVQSGAELVNQAGDTLKEIVDSVNQVADIMSEIASASAQQSSGIDEINSAVAAMDEMTQQNSALVEQNTAAAHSLVDQAQELERMMRFFNVGEEEFEEQAPAVASAGGRSQAKSTAARGKTVAVKAPAAKAAPKIESPRNPASKKKSYDDGWEEF